MSTVLCDCKAIINSCPLTYITEKDQLITLSTAMILQEIETHGIWNVSSGL